VSHASITFESDGPVGEPSTATLPCAALMRAAISRCASSHVTFASEPSAPRFCGPRWRSGWKVRPIDAWPRAHSVPRFTGWSGLPSSLIGRLSRVRTCMPHADAHSWQVDA